MSNVVTLSEAAALGPDQAGGKAATLGALAGEHTVPQGFVVTTPAFVEHFERAGFDFGATPPQLPDDAALARLRAMPLDSQLAREVHAAFSVLPSTNGRRPICAVRSSAVGEDGAALSFAGQHATYYYVEQGDVEQRIVDCWLSCWSAEAQSYRREFDIVASPRMAVIVQLMVASEVSGVTFTRDPTGRNRDCLIVESCWGLGAALVDGRVTADSYVVRRGSHELIERRLGSKRFKVAEDLIDPVGTRHSPSRDICNAARH